MLRRFFATGSALIALAATAMALAAGTARAAALQQEAQVTCNPFSNLIEITPVIGADPDNGNSQRVAWRHWIYNIDTQTKTWAPANAGGAWSAMTHTITYWVDDPSNFWSGGGYWTTVYTANTPTQVASVRDGRYFVYTQYAWLYGSTWYYVLPDGSLTTTQPTQGIPTRSYGNYLGSYLTYCKI